MLFFLVPAGEIFARDRVALVVGISEYSEDFDLPNASPDAEVVAESLREVGFQVTEITNGQKLTRKALLAAIRRFRSDAKDADAAIVYFAGHGVEVKGTNWLLPSDAYAETPDDLEPEAIRASYLANAVSGASRVRLVILDACRNNPFRSFRGWVSNTRASASVGLARDSGIDPNVVVLMATQPGQKSADGVGLGNSPFALALASTLGREQLQISSLPSYVSRHMLEVSQVYQRPDQQGIFDVPDWTFNIEKPQKSKSPQKSIAVRKNPPQVAKLSPSTQASTALSGTLNGSATKLLEDCETLSDSKNIYRVGYNYRVTPLPAIRACLKAIEADPGNGAVMVNLYQAYRANRKYTKGEEWLRRASAQGHPDAMTTLAGALIKRYGNKNPTDRENNKSGIDLYKRAAAAGSPRAMHQLGILYQFGLDGDLQVDTPKAMEWYEKAADQGYVSSMERIGEAYLSGRGVEKNFDKGKKWIELAVSNGQSSALDDIHRLALIYETRKNANAVLEKEEAREAIKLYELAASLGGAKSMRNLGYLHLNGRIVPQNYTVAKKWFEKGAAKDDPGSFYALGLMYLGDLAGPKDNSKAVEYLEKSASLGERSAMLKLGNIHKSGDIVPVDYAKAKEWFEKGIAKFDRRAKNALGLLYLEGKGTPRDPLKARELFESAASPIKTSNFHSAIYNLGYMYRYGIGMPKNAAKARELFETAASRGSEAAKKALLEMPES